MSKLDLQALYVPEDERSYYLQVERLVDNGTRMVIAAAKEGKTSINNWGVLVDIKAVELIIRQLKKRFPDAVVEYKIKEGSELKYILIDWT